MRYAVDIDAIHFCPVNGTRTARVEIVWSLLLPALVLVHDRGNQLAQVAFAALLAGAMFAVPSGYALHYGLPFFLGVLLSRAGRLPAPGAVTLAGLAIIWACSALRSNSVAVELGIALGAALIVWGALFSPMAARLLSTRPVRLLGRVSFSFYIVHFPLLFATMLALDQWAPGLAGFAGNAAAFAISSTATLGLSLLTYRFVETPGVNAGKALSARLKRHRYLSRQTSRT